MSRPGAPHVVMNAQTALQTLETHASCFLKIASGFQADVAAISSVYGHAARIVRHFPDNAGGWIAGGADAAEEPFGLLRRAGYE